MTMWPFNRPQKPSETSPPGLEDRLHAVERSLAELRADVSLLRREWADTLDKLQTWFGREAARKRAQLHKQLELEPQPAAQEPVGAAIDSQAERASLKAALRRKVAAGRFSHPNGGGQ